MWQRKTKSAAFMNQFNDQLGWDEHDEFAQLEDLKLFIEAWDFASRQYGYPQLDLLQFEDIIQKRIEEFWGPCDCRFLRGERRILVRSKDGKTTEIVTGEELPPPPIRSLREMVLH